MPLQWCIAALVSVGQTQASKPENSAAAVLPAVTVLTHDAARPADFQNWSELYDAQRFFLKCACCVHEAVRRSLPMICYAVHQREHWHRCTEHVVIVL